MKDKISLRKEFSLLREKARCSEVDEQLFQVFSTSPFLRYSSFFLYRSFRTEADTSRLARFLKEERKRVCFPRIEGKTMLAVYDEGKWEEGAFGILQPQKGEDEPCEVAITPLLAFDKTGNRLGYGGGYYDGYFATHPNILRVGYAYDEQEYDKILPVEPQDKKLHAIITQSGVRFFGEINA